MPAGGLNIASLRRRRAKVPRSADYTGRRAALRRHGGPPVSSTLNLPNYPGVAVLVHPRIDRRQAVRSGHSHPGRGWEAWQDQPIPMRVRVTSSHRTGDQYDAGDQYSDCDQLLHLNFLASFAQQLGDCIAEPTPDGRYQACHDYRHSGFLR